MNVVNNVNRHVDNIPGYRHLLRVYLNIFVVIVLLRLNVVELWNIHGKIKSRIHGLAQMFNGIN